MRHSTDTAPLNTRPRPLDVWANRLRVASKPSTQTITDTSSQAAPPQSSNEEREITIKIPDREVAARHRKETNKQLRTYVEIGLLKYPSLRVPTQEVEMVTQLKFGDLRLLMRTRGAIETLRIAKNVKK